jgi:hypothetical protein
LRISRVPAAYCSEWRFLVYAHPLFLGFLAFLTFLPPAAGRVLLGMGETRPAGFVGYVRLMRLGGFSWV